MQKVIILGATGSLGLQTLEVLEKHKAHFQIVGLTADKNEQLLKNLAKKFKVTKTILTSRDGSKSLETFIKNSTANIVVNVLPGISGIQPSITALRSGKILLLGNKESLVAEGQKIMKLGKVIPLDSEHNAIFEILKYLAKKSPNLKISRLILPCSGGPFLKTSPKKLAKITPAQALNHPRWQMGGKISIESATLINKGLEIIEAHHLFQIPLSKISVKIHPQCQIHGMVELKNGQTFAYISAPDMREHIENALLYAANLPSPKRNIRQLTKIELKKLQAPTPALHAKLPGIKLTLAHFKSHPLKMAKFLKKEEKVINQFLQNKISFPQIFEKLKTWRS